jgi:Bifunctional DNA primase/polymerase, N-terminal
MSSDGPLPQSTSDNNLDTISSLDNSVLTQAQVFSAMGIPVFPIKIVQRADGSWDKVPLIRDWVEAASTPDKFDWSRANGCGLRMGNGWYALDVDIRKPGAREAAILWIDAHKVPRTTRQHLTVSGGFHLIYRLPLGWENLRTRANVVTGLDTRGAGGFIAFGAGYRVADGRDVPPAMLPVDACMALDAASERGGTLVIGALTPVDTDELQNKLNIILSNRTGQLARRWAGIGTGMADSSRSAMDMSVARLLAQCGFTESEIVTALIDFYRYGQAAALGGAKGTRAAHRCAARAILESNEVPPPETDEDSADIQRVMAGLIARASRRAAA